ncbi:hypothetical protein [Vibrio salinus]|uniref:hypothetical protein n=1 Tax=Vibrio salinus TaxID=2899784 RepID=UPI001E45A007|nr:hypothetical protein [Vibrio salinus]MCE0495776.1 hypothetical protein [Vibrio salinus]
MSGYFQAFNDSGNYLIDGVYKSFVLSRKLTVTTSVNVQSKYRYVDISVSSGEIIAIRSGVPVFLIFRSSTVIRLGTNGTAARAFTVYIFKNNPTPEDSGAGLEVYNAAGECVYNSVQLPLNIVGIKTGLSSFTFDTSRIYAAVIISSSGTLTSAYTAVMGPNIIFHLYIGVTSGVNYVSGGIQTSNVEYYSSQSNETYSSGQSYPSYSYSGKECKIAIIDVTGY